MTEALTPAVHPEPIPGAAQPARRPPPSAFGKQVQWWQSLLGIVVILVLIPFIFGMDPAKFRIFVGIDPADSVFKPDILTSIWYFIFLGIATTVLSAAVAILLSLPLAIGLALGRLSPYGWVRWPSILYIEVFRALPVLLLIFFIFYEMPANLPLVTLVTREFFTVTLALLIYTAALNAEILRAGIVALDKGQTEAARALGLSYWQTMRAIILPQTFRNVLPTLIAQFTTLLKDTSLGSLIGMVELLQRGRIVFQGYKNPLETLFVIAVIYFILNFILERISIAIQERRRRHARVAAPVAPAAPLPEHAA